MLNVVVHIVTTWISRMKCTVRIVPKHRHSQTLGIVVSYEASQLCSNTTTGNTKYFSSSAPLPTPTPTLPPSLALQLLTVKRRVKIKHEMRF